MFSFATSKLQLIVYNPGCLATGGCQQMAGGFAYKNGEKDKHVKAKDKVDQK